MLLNRGQALEMVKKGLRPLMLEDDRKHIEELLDLHVTKLTSLTGVIIGENLFFSAIGMLATRGFKFKQGGKK